MSPLTVKPGWRTTEFATTLASLVAGVLALLVPHVAGTGLPDQVQTALVAVMGVVAGIYPVTRARVKVAAHTAAGYAADSIAAAGSPAVPPPTAPSGASGAVVVPSGGGGGAPGPG